MRARVDPAFEARLRAEYAGRKDASHMATQCRYAGHWEQANWWRGIVREYDHCIAILEGRKQP